MIQQLLCFLNYHDYESRDVATLTGRGDHLVQRLSVCKHCNHVPNYPHIYSYHLDQPLEGWEESCSHRIKREAQYAAENQRRTNESLVVFQEIQIKRGHKEAQEKLRDEQANYDHERKIS